MTRDPRTFTWTPEVQAAIDEACAQIIAERSAQASYARQCAYVVGILFGLVIFAIMLPNVVRGSFVWVWGRPIIAVAAFAAGVWLARWGWADGADDETDDWEDDDGFDE